MSLSGIAAAAAGALVGGMYLDARLHVGNDLRQGNKKLMMHFAMRYIAQKVRENKLLVYNILEDRADTPAGEGLCLMFEDRQWTYTEFYHAIRPVANWLLNDLGIKKGEVVAVDGGNTPEYLLFFFALQAIGAVPALLNCNLTGNALSHSIKLSTSRYVLADKDVKHLVEPVEPELKDAAVTVVYYSTDFVQTFTDASPLPKDRQVGLDPQGPAALLYTSGTTGLPKGVIMSRSRFLLLARMIPGILPLKAGDRMYTCLPFYHASALALCLGPCLFSGAAVIQGRKFSHSTFWPDVHRSKATHVQYVGELCRYLLNAAPGPLDRGHAVHSVWGNGMRPDVWQSFRERFGIDTVIELYAASDGVVVTINKNRGDFTRETIGLRGPLWHLLNGGTEKYILVDSDTQEIRRGKDGWAIEAKTDEICEIISQMDTTDPEKGSPQYFNNKAATEKRRVSDVFRKGDLWYRSGDLFRLDGQGRLYFVDRLGDTFRWHSENVSTNEVSDALGVFPQIAEANVYGVKVPHAEGRAGCAAVVVKSGASTDLNTLATITTTTGTSSNPSSITSTTVKKEQDKENQLASVSSPPPQIDLAALAAHCLGCLPRYAVPLFLRVTAALDHTGTHKLQKQKLRNEGIELAQIRAAGNDQMFWLPPGSKAYVPFTDADLDGLKAGRVRL
ncbi:fatty-acyl-CoA synthase [Nemania sp. FL0916]|nr:fatty-acyl-CoA synthase [Nemania sp. FL0916]